LNLQAVRRQPGAARETPLPLPEDAGREEVLDAAAAAFLERGYAATSIDDVADRLGCTKGRVYHHFHTKGGLFLGVYQRAFRAAIDAVQPIMRSRSSAAERLYQMAQAHVRLTLDAGQAGLAVGDTEMALVSEGRTPSQVLLDVSALRKQYEDCFVAVIEQGVKSGEFRPVDPYLMAKASLGALNRAGTRNPAAADGPVGGESDVAAEFAAFVTRALTSPDGVRAQADRLARPMAAVG
jgi:AcrR family transcriptional regulator